MHKAHKNRKDKRALGNLSAYLFSVPANFWSAMTERLTLCTKSTTGTRKFWRGLILRIRLSSVMVSKHA